MEMFGQLAGSVTHDFNNLLCVILGYAESALSSRNLDADLRESLEEIQSAGKRATALTRQLLAVLREQNVKTGPVDLNKVVRETQSMLAPLINEHINVALLLEDALPAVDADAGQLEQVLLNLSINARDAMPYGGCLSIRTRALASSFVELQVSDTGHGMGKETKRRIFDPFFTTKGHRGTGLGLTTVLNLVQKNHGEIDVNSAPGKGTTFILRFHATS